jgi:hypothetical protein
MRHFPSRAPVSLEQARTTFICKLPDSQSLEEVARMFIVMGLDVELDAETRTLIVRRDPNLIETAA